MTGGPRGFTSPPPRCTPHLLQEFPFEAPRLDFGFHSSDHDPVQFSGGFNEKEHRYHWTIVIVHGIRWAGRNS